MSQTDFSKHAYSIDELAKKGPIRRSSIYNQIAAGTLRARKIGRRTIVLDEDWRAFLDSAPVIPPANSTATLTAPPHRRGKLRKIPLNALTEPVEAQATSTGATATTEGSHTQAEAGDLS